MRRAGQVRRRDACELEIIRVLRKCGVKVQQISGDQAPDLLAYFQGRWLPIECKSATGKIRAGQEAYPIARTPDEALALLGIKGTS